MTKTRVWVPAGDAVEAVIQIEANTAPAAEREVKEVKRRMKRRMVKRKAKRGQNVKIPWLGMLGPMHVRKCVQAG